jgi:hypothetical protein
LLSLCQVKISLCNEVLRMVPEHISKSPTLICSQLLIHLIALKGFLEVDWHLSSNFSKNFWSHVSITGFLEEQVLSLSKTEIAIHG